MKGGGCKESFTVSVQLQDWKLAWDNACRPDRDYQLFIVLSFTVHYQRWVFTINIAMRSTSSCDILPLSQCWNAELE